MTSRAAADTAPPVPDYARRYRRRALASDALVTVLWASGAVPAALFFIQSGPTGFGSTADTVSILGLVAGLIGTDFLLAMLVLAARIPFIDRTIGHGRAIAVHRALGKPALYLILVHVLLLLVGSGMTVGVNAIDEIGGRLGSLFRDSDLALAYLGVLLLVAVVATSLVIVQRKLGREAWHAVHLLSYAAVLVAVPHELSAGGVLADGTFQRGYWIALYVLAFGAVVVYRFGVPILSSLRHRMRVARVIHEGPGVVSIELTGHGLRSLESAGGQYLIWRFWTRRTWWHAHPMSLSSVPHDDTARITVRELGEGSRRISAVPVGTAVWIEGPYGLFTDSARTAPKLAIAAAGIGIAPVRALLEHAELRPGEATILLRAGSLSETALWAETIELAETKGAVVHTMIGRRDPDAPGWLSQDEQQLGTTIESVFPELADSDLYLCGPAAWIDLVEADAVEAGIPTHQLHAERF
jgi:predicted ferric reductase